MSKPQPRVTISELALNELLAVFNETLDSINSIRHCMWESLGSTDDKKMGTFLKGVELNAAALDDHLIAGEHVMNRIKCQVREYKRLEKIVAERVKKELAG